MIMDGLLLSKAGHELQGDNVTFPFLRYATELTFPSGFEDRVASLLDEVGDASI